MHNDQKREKTINMCCRKIKNMDLEKISNSGQCFRMWKKENEDGIRYALIAGNRYLEVQQNEEEFYFFCSEEELEGFWKDYFDLDMDYTQVIAGVDQEDLYLKEAVDFAAGIRILQQDLWEMIITFIISQQNNIRRIRKCIEAICEKYGQECTAPDGTSYYAFPTPEEFSKATEDELRACNLGYRSRYLVETARMVREGEVSLEQISESLPENARTELMKLTGVGKKVADCICLFALHDLVSFPVDTHIRQVLEAHYPQGFPFERYPETAGILQQYMFYYDLWNK